MNRRSLLRLAICNLLFINIFFANCIINNFNVQRSYAAVQDFPRQYFAPDVDVALADNPFPNVISQASKVAGTKYYELGFITAKQGQCRGLWGGENSLAYMQGDIANLRASGGDIVLNFGGYAAGNPSDASVNPRQEEELALACPTVASLQAQYQQAITAYHATHVAFAIEGDVLSNSKYSASIGLRNQAIAGLKSGVPGRPLCVEFTLTGTITGLTDQGEVLLKDAIDRGINICLVNILAMNYGSAVPVDQPGAMGQYAINALQEAFFQIKFLFPQKSDSQIWSMMGVTIMNGVNNSSGQGGREIFTLVDAQTLLQFALKNKIREVSMWELHRDQPPPNDNVIAPTDTVTTTPNMNSGIQQKPYEFSTAFNTFTSSPECPSDQPNVTSPFVGIPPASGSMASPVSRSVTPPSSVNSSAKSKVTPPGSGNPTKKVNGNNVTNPNCVGILGGTAAPVGTVKPNATVNPSSTAIVTGSDSQSCASRVNSNRVSPSLPGSSNKPTQPNVSGLSPSSLLPSGLNTGNGGLDLTIGRSGGQLRVGQQVNYVLTPCRLPSVGNAMIFIADTISAGLTGLQTNSTNWQIVYNSTFGNGSMTIIALYTGPRTTAPGGVLPPFTFSGMLTAAAVPRLISFALLTTVDGTSGSLGTSGLSGTLGLSLNAKITGWAAALDTLFVQ
jgi:chitinase